MAKSAARKKETEDSAWFCFPDESPCHDGTPGTHAVGHVAPVVQIVENTCSSCREEALWDLASGDLPMKSVHLITLLAFIVGCGPGTGSPDSGSPDAGSLDAGQPDSGMDAGSCSMLTVKNVDVWCTVTVAGGTPSAAAEQTVCVAPGTVNLAATANTGFVLGDWHHTTGDTGSGDPGTVTNGVSAATVRVGSSNACVWICCPGVGGVPACPTTDACP
jgi:hypothetical protein